MGVFPAAGCKSKENESTSRGDRGKKGTRNLKFKKKISVRRLDQREGGEFFRASRKGKSDHGMDTLGDPVSSQGGGENMVDTPDQGNKGSSSTCWEGGKKPARN